MPTDNSGTGSRFEFLDFMCQQKTEFVDYDTAGYEYVKDATDVRLVRLSAPSSKLLSSKIKSLSENPSLQPEVTNEKCDEKFRHAVLYSNADNLVSALSTKVPRFHSTNTAPPKLCFLITCQATQYAGMGRGVYDWSPVFRHHFDACDALIKEECGLSVKSLMNSEDNSWTNNPLEALPYILSLEYCLSKLWESWGIKPDIVLGTSFGEYGAAVISGIISLRDAVKLIMTRAQLVIDNIKEEAFGIVEMDSSEFSTVMEEVKNVDGMQDAWLDIACENSPLQTCVVGYRRYVHKFMEICKGKGLKGKLLDPYHPYHSRLSSPVVSQFEKLTARVEYKKASNGILVSTVRNGKKMETLDKDYYLEHLVGPALCADAISTVINDRDVTHFVEVGPHPINIQMVKDVLEYKFPEMGRDYKFYPSLLRTSNDKLTLLNALGGLYTAGFNINWENVD